MTDTIAAVSTLKLGTASALASTRNALEAILEESQHVAEAIIVASRHSRMLQLLRITRAAATCLVAQTIVGDRPPRAVLEPTPYFSAAYQDCRPS